MQPDMSASSSTTSAVGQATAASKRGGKARARLTPMFPVDYDSGSESDDACPRVVPDRDYEVAILMQQAESAHFGSERREPAGDAEFAQHFAGEVRPRTSPA